VNTPLITTSDCEGAGELFRVSTLDLVNTPRTADGKVDFDKDFFASEAFLTVSGQLNVESFALALTDVYTFGPTFRAENSNTSRHLAEFWMIEPEMAFYDLKDSVVLAEEFLKYLLSHCLENHRNDLEFLQKFYDQSLIQTLENIVSSRFKTVTYTEAIDILEKSNKSFEFVIKWGMDLQSEHERYLTEQHFKCPIVLSNYPQDIKAFYMRRNDDGQTVAAMDVLFPRLGEIIGGSQREERYDYLLERIQEHGLNEKEYWWYLDLRRYGPVPNSGFGFGFERIVRLYSAFTAQ